MSSNSARPTGRRTTDLAEPLSVVLREPRRKRALSTLVSEAGRTSFEDLAVAVTAFERANGGDAPETPSEEVQVTLYHSHLPKLAEVGLLKDDYDTDGDVELTQRGFEVAAMLEGRRSR